MDSEDVSSRNKEFLISWIVLLMLFLIATILYGLVYYYSAIFYNNLLTGSDLCNFYTCSVKSDECGHYPLIKFPDGTSKCDRG